MKRIVAFIISAALAVLLAAFLPLGESVSPAMIWIIRVTAATFLFCLIATLLHGAASYFEKNKGQAVHIPILIVFLAMIVYPLVVRDTFDPGRELRAETVKPVLVSQEAGLNLSFPSQYEDWFNDHFGGRNTMIRANSRLHYHLFNLSISDKIMVGEDNWLIYTSKADGNSIGYYQRNTPWTEQQLGSAAATLNMMWRLFEGNGIHFAFALAPGQFDVYPEKYPASILRADKPSIVEQFLAYMRENTQAPVYDLIEPLRLHRETSERELFFQADTHWNHLGAFLGYRALAEGLSKEFEGIVPLNIDDFTITREYYASGGDLLPMLNLTPEDFKGEIYSYLFEPAVPFAYTKTHDPENYSNFTTVHPDGSLPTAIVYRDSFFTLLEPFLSNHFSQAEYIWNVLNPSTEIAYILEKKPDIVIFELTTRYLERLLTLF